MQSYVTMPPVRPSIVRSEVVPEWGQGSYRALRQHADSVHVGCILLVQPMPVDANPLSILQSICDVNNDSVPFAYLVGNKW